MKRASMNSFSCIPPHANHRDRSEVSVNQHSWIKPFSTSVWSLIVFPHIFSYCQIKTPLFLLKNSLSCLKDLGQLSCESHAACLSGSEGISRLQIHPLTLFMAIQFECIKHCWAHWESSFSRRLDKTHHVTICMQATCMLSKNAWYLQPQHLRAPILGDNANIHFHRWTAAVGGRRKKKGNTFHYVT